VTRLDELKKLVTLQPNDAMLHYGLALEYAKLERPDEAIAEFQRAIELDGQFVAAYHHKARTEISAGRRAAARATLAAGIAVAKAAGDAHLQQKMNELLDAMA
jgi:Tfp pilus assembly protein PilF